jgi:hypothetical protein
VFRLTVPLPVIVPPVRPFPAVTLVTVPPKLGAVLVKVIVLPRATVPPPDNPVPAFTVMEGVDSIAFVTPPVAMPIVPVLVIVPPDSPAPAATLVTVPPELGAEFVSVIVPPKATVPPPDNPEPAVTVIEGVANMAFVIPPVAMPMVPVLVIVPPVSPVPAATLVTVPEPVPGKVWPEAKVMRPLLATESPVSVGVVPFAPKRRCRLPEGLAVSLPVGSACQRKRCGTDAAVLLLNDALMKSSGLELKPAVAVAAPRFGRRLPADAVIRPLKFPVVAFNAPEKVPVVPFNAPVRVPPASSK